MNADLRVMTFNIRNSCSKDGPDAWPLRRAAWIDAVRAFDPDLLAVQEVCNDQHAQLLPVFPDYGFVGVARDGDPIKGERALVMYRSARFEQLAAGDFWLSQTPEIPASRSWDAAYVRICSWCRLLDKESARPLLFANTHFDNEGAVARAQSAKLLQSRLPTLAQSAPIILAGDFNCTELDEPYRMLLDSGLRDSYRDLHPHCAGNEATYHEFAGKTAGYRIDWILHTPGLVAKQSQIVCDKAASGRYPSDHFPLTAVLRMDQT